MKTIEDFAVSAFRFRNDTLYVTVKDLVSDTEITYKLNDLEEDYPGVYNSLSDLADRVILDVLV